MSALTLNHPAPATVRPIVTTDDLAMAFVEDRMRNLSDRHGVTVSYDRDGARGRALDRGNLTLYGAFDPTLTFASAVFGITADMNGETVGVLQMAVYDFGQYDLHQYMSTFGLFRGSPKIEFREPAIFLASGLQGKLGFNGDLWVHPRLRGGSDFARDWTMNAAMINRVLAMSTLGATGIFLFMRERVYRKVQSRAQTSCMGVCWDDEERAILYSGQKFIRDRMFEMSPDLMSRH